MDARRCFRENAQAAASTIDFTVTEANELYLAEGGGAPEFIYSVASL